MKIRILYFLFLLSVSVFVKGQENREINRVNNIESKVLFTPKDAYIYYNGIEKPRFQLNDSIKDININIDKSIPFKLQLKYGDYSFNHDPYAFDFKYQGNIANFRHGYIYGSSYHETMPGLLSRQSSSIALHYSIGRFVIDGNLIGNRYLVNGIDTQIGISGSASYMINNNMSFTIFGNYYNTNPYYYMANISYISSSSYGGFISLFNDNVGIDLGVQRRYDSYKRQFEYVPIITPKFNLTPKIKIELPVGDIMKELMYDAIFKKQNNKGGGTIMPEVINHNIPIR